MIVIGAMGLYAFMSINVEAYPDPAPAIVEVIAQMPGASAEEVERQVTIPLEVALAGMPGLDSTRSKSLFGLSHLRNQFDYGVPLSSRPAGSDQPAGTRQSAQRRAAADFADVADRRNRSLHAARIRKDAFGQRDLHPQRSEVAQDWTLRRDFRRVPRIVDIVSYGGTDKALRDPARSRPLLRYGITLDQLQNAIRASNANVGGDYLVQGDTDRGGPQPRPDRAAAKIRSTARWRTNDPAAARQLSARARSTPGHGDSPGRLGVDQQRADPRRRRRRGRAATKHEDSRRQAGRRGRQSAAAWAA